MTTQPIPRRPATLTALPLSALQQRLWFLCTSYQGNASPTVYLAHRLRGPVDLDALAAAIVDVSDRQESMRTRFVTGPDGAPAVVLDPPGGLTVERLDLSDLPPDAREQRLHQLLDAWARTLFELRGGCLVRARIVRMGDDDHVLSVVLHHIISDGASSTVLAREIGAHYRARTTGEPPQVPDLVVQYPDFAYWQSLGEGLGGAEGLAYWTDRLAGLPVPDLTTDRPRPAQKGTRGEEVLHPLGLELAVALERFARAQRASLFAVLLAAFWTLLSRHGAGEDICVGSPIGGRTRVEFEPLIGNFGNTLPLRGDLSGDPTFAELLARARAVTFGALEHQDVPFAHVVAALDLPVDQSRMQVFGAIMVLQYAGGEDPLPGLPAQAIPAAAPQITHDVVLDAWRGVNDGLVLVLRYDSALFEAATIRAWVAEYEALLRAALADPQTRLSALARPVEVRA